MLCTIDVFVLKYCTNRLALAGDTDREDIPSRSKAPHSNCVLFLPENSAMFSMSVRVCVSVGLCDMCVCLYLSTRLADPSAEVLRGY